MTAALTAAPTPDVHLLNKIADWHIARAEARLMLAHSNKADLFGLNEDNDVPVDPAGPALDRMRECEDALARFEPSTIMGAYELLRVAIEIEATKVGDTMESVLASGPVLPIIKTVAQALVWGDGGRRIGPDAA